MSDEPNALRVLGYQVAPELFTLGYARNSGPCACTSACCKRGVYADLRERDRILLHKELVQRHMDESQNRNEGDWFEPEEKLDADFPSGKCAGTAELNGKCAFLDSRGLCSLQLAATAEGMHKWALKPLYCVLYPIDVSASVIKFDFRFQDQQACCSITSSFEIPLYEACRHELVHLVGEAGFEQIKKHALARDPAPEQPPTEHGDGPRLNSGG